MKKMVLISTLTLAVSSIAVAQSDDERASLIAQGEYISRLGDCMGCHTTDNKRPYSGGLKIQSPFGVIYSTNISPDLKHGIGEYSEEEFSRAVREGVRRDGTYLYPAMPYPSYAKMSDKDIHALYVYFMYGVKPDKQLTPKTDLGFPFNQRWGIGFWNFFFTDNEQFKLHSKVDEDVNRGAYLVEGLGHCGSCHTPRAITMQEKAYDGSSEDYLAGTELNGWNVPSLRAGGKDTKGITSWSQKDIVQYLQTGRNQHASVGGEMTSVIQHSSGYMTDSDLNAIAAYLKSLSGKKVSDDTNNSVSISKTEQRLSAATNLDAGERVYIDNCTACHFISGRGAPPTFPPLVGNELVNADNPTGLITVILNGAKMPTTSKAPTQLAMPDFGWRLTDQQVADLTSFIRSGWGNRQKAVTPDYVKQVRQSLPKPEITSKPEDLDGVRAYSERK
jgi:mono/diheme cytochrome c family protein